MDFLIKLVMMIFITYILILVLSYVSFGGVVMVKRLINHISTLFVRGKK